MGSALPLPHRNHRTRSTANVGQPLLFAPGFFVLESWPVVPAISCRAEGQTAAMALGAVCHVRVV
jgi:hypothetical protein